MSSSTTKSRCTLMCLHPVPAHMSTEEFARKFEIALDAVLSLPICRENFLKYEIMIPNGRLDSYFKALNIPSEPRMVITRSECETTDHVSQILRDAELIKLTSGEEFSDASVFIVDETIRLDTQSSDDCDGSYVIILKCPPHVSAAELDGKYKEAVDQVVQLPGFKNNVVKHTTWVKNEGLAPDAQLLGMFSAEPVVIVMVQSSFDRITAVWTDSEFKHYIGGLDKTLENRLQFGVDVVAKI
ncbi:hypothetical protein C8R45DRAFT_1014106 [Mycena sanguinolenta]|nr:hypothetical protein C8R45DRAFT_1014106 [Mycena sanguinolenta]